MRPSQHELVPSPVDQISLAFRDHRRRLGLSQRAYAVRRALSKSLVAKLETRPDALPLDTLLEVLDGTGYTLRLVSEDVASRLPELDWETTDLLARDRGRRRFPAHRQVRPSPGGPYWWWYHEVMGTGHCGPQPRWTTEYPK